jgi:hypothetical protein
VTDSTPATAALTALPPKYEPGQDYDDTFHVTEIDGGRTVAVCPTWADSLLVSTALNTLAAMYPWAVPDGT